MWIVMAILIMAILYLIVVASDETKRVRNEGLIANEEIIGLAKRNEELTTERDELKSLRRQEIQNNTVLTNKNRELKEFKTAIEDVMNDDELLMINKIDKIKELLSKQR